MWVQTTIGNLFVSRRYKIAFSVKDLVNLTSEMSVKNQAGCNPTLLVGNWKELFLRYRVKCSLKGSDPQGHEVRLRFNTKKIVKGSGINNLDVKVSCTCPAFLYWGAQWNLGQGDSLEGKPRPLYQAPDPKNKERFQFVICKHIKVVADRIGPYLTRLLNKYRDDQVEVTLKRYEEDEPEVKVIEEEEEEPVTEINPPTEKAPPAPVPEEPVPEEEEEPVEESEAPAPKPEKKQPEKKPEEPKAPPKQKRIEEEPKLIEEEEEPVVERTEPAKKKKPLKEDLNLPKPEEEEEE